MMVEKHKGCVLRQNQDCIYYAIHSTRLGNFNVHYGGQKGNAYPGAGGGGPEPHERLTSSWHECQRLPELFGHIYMNGRIRGLFL
jgi:hypothetical protein